eukprot:813508-Pleurochrysis_carterae.AAC.2
MADEVRGRTGRMRGQRSEERAAVETELRNEAVEEAALRIKPTCDWGEARCAPDTWQMNDTVKEVTYEDVVLHASDIGSCEELVRRYNKNQLVVVRDACRQNSFSLADLCDTFAMHSSWVRSEWGVENGSEELHGDPALVLGGAKPPPGSWYVSCILQGDDSRIRRLLRHVGLPALLCNSRNAAHDNRIEHGDALWVFVGRHDGGETVAPLEGRGEHVDQGQQLCGPASMSTLCTWRRTWTPSVA